MEIIKGKVHWVDIVRPSPNDIEMLKREFHFNPLVLAELKGISARTRVDDYGTYLFIIYQFPIYDPIEKVSRRSEVDFLITKKEVVTIRYEDHTAFDTFRTHLADKNFKDKTLQNTLQLTYQLIDAILNYDHRQLHHMREKLEKIGNELFKDQEARILQDISYLKRDLSEYKIIFEPQHELLKTLLENAGTFWGPVSKPYIGALIGDHTKLLNELESYRDAVADFDATNNQLMNIKSTQIMQRFTILAFFTLPFVLIANLFGMNVADTPLVNQPHAFWIIVSAMIILTVVMVAYLKIRRWF